MAVRINAKFVRLRLIELEMDQRSLAREARVTEQTVSRLMQGSAFDSKTLGKLAEALEVHPVDLIEAEGFSSPHVDAPAAAFAGT